MCRVCFLFLLALSKSLYRIQVLNNIDRSSHELSYSKPMRATVNILDSRAMLRMDIVF